MNKLFKLIAFVGVFALAACGGGGGGTDTSYNDPSNPYTPDDSYDPGDMADLKIVSFAVSPGVDASGAGQFAFSYTLRNDGDAPATAFWLGIDVGIFLSKDATITASDLYLGDTRSNDVTDPLLPGEEIFVNGMIDIPDHIPSGQYFIGAIVNPHAFYIDRLPDGTAGVQYVAESDYTNNYSAVSPFYVTGTAACTDDSYEPDTARTEATQISLGHTQYRNLCSDNADWVKFDVAAGGTYTFTANYIGRNSQLNIRLYDTDGTTLLASNKSTQDSVSLSWIAPKSGTYYALIDSYWYLSQFAGVGLDTEYTLTLQ